MNLSLKTHLLISTIADVLMLIFIITSSLELITIFAYLFITKYLFWIGEFFKGLITMLVHSKETVGILAGMGLCAIVLIQLMNMSGFFLWYLATGTDFYFQTAINTLIYSNALLATTISFSAIPLSFILFIAKKEFNSKEGFIALLNAMFYPIALIFILLILGVGLIFLRNTQIAIGILFFAIIIIDKGIIYLEKVFTEGKPPPNFVLRLADRIR